MFRKLTRCCTGMKQEAFGDAGYIGVDKRDEMKQVGEVARGGQARKDQGDAGRCAEGSGNRTRANQGANPRAGRASVSCRQEPVPSSQGALQGLFKNTAQLFSLFALANLVIARNRLRSIHGGNPSCM
jgi:IS5 family transposase